MMNKRETACYMTGILFACATLHVHGKQVQASEIIAAVGGLKEVRKGICCEQDIETFDWLKGFCK